MTAAMRPNPGLHRTIGSLARSIACSPVNAKILSQPDVGPVYDAVCEAEVTMNRRIIAFALVAGVLLVLWSFRRAARAPVSNEAMINSEAPVRDTPIVARSINPQSMVPKFVAEPDAKASEEEAADGIVVTGQVVEHDTGGPLQGIRIQVKGTLSLLPIETTTAADGRFKLTNLIAAPAATLSFDSPTGSHISELRRVAIARTAGADAGTIRLFKVNPGNPGNGSLGLRLRSQNGRAVVRAVQAGSPAERAGLRVNDAILQINGEVPAGDELDVVATLRVNPGEQVTLLVQTAKQRPRHVKFGRGP
jgi:hypothetical protein